METLFPPSLSNCMFLVLCFMGAAVHLEWVWIWVFDQLHLFRIKKNCDKWSLDCYWKKQDCYTTSASDDSKAFPAEGEQPAQSELMLYISHSYPVK